MLPRSPSFLVLTYCLSGAAHAAEQPVGSTERVIVWGVLPNRIEDAPGATGLLDSEDIETLRPYTMHDAFEFMPGVRTLDDDIFGRRSGIGIRGSPSRRSRNVLLLEDGVPINASTYLDASAHYTPPLERLERIEVLKANGQIPYGPLNNHGVINFASKRPTDAPRTDVDVALGTGGANRQHLMHRRTDGALGSVLSYTRFDADGAFDVEDTEFQDFHGALDWELGARHNVRLSGVYFRERSHYDESNLTPQEFALAPRTKRGRFGQEFNTIAVDYFKADVTHDVRLTDRWSASTKAFFTDLDRPRFTVDPGEYDIAALPDLVLVDGDGTFVPGLDGNGQMISRDRHYRTLGIESRMALSGLRTGGAEHTLEWGVRLERHRLDDRRTEGEIGEILTEGNRGVLTRDEQYRADAYSLFVQDIVRSGNWTVVPGVRTEHYEQRRQRVFPTVDPREVHEESIVLPGISALYSGFEDSEIFASVQRGYAPATARGSEFPLVPEVGVNSQVGLRTEIGDIASLELAGFYNVLSNTLVQLPYIDPVTFASVVINAEDSEAFGVDVGLRLNSAAESAHNVYGHLAYNYTDARFTEGLSNGNRVPEVPLHSGSITLGYEHARGFHVSATLTYEGEFFTEPFNIRAPILANEDGEPLGPGDAIDLREPIVLGAVGSRTLLSARASYAVPGTTAKVWIQGRNLTDKNYVADFSNGLRPGAERAVIAGVSMRFGEE